MFLAPMTELISLGWNAPGLALSFGALVIAFLLRTLPRLVLSTFTAFQSTPTTHRLAIQESQLASFRRKHWTFPLHISGDGRPAKLTVFVPVRSAETERRRLGPIEIAMGPQTSVTASQSSVVPPEICEPNNEDGVASCMLLVL